MVKGSMAWGLITLGSLLTLSATSSDLRLVDAVRKGDQEAVAVLLPQVDVNARQPDGATALAWAAHRDDLETAKLLIQGGADVNAANEYGATPLSLGCINRNAQMVELLLEAGADPNAKLLKGETAIMTCTRTGTAGGVKALVAHGADVDVRVPWRKQTALMWAAANRRPQVTKALIEAGADVNAGSRNGFTPLMFAAQQGDVDSAKILLAAGADVNAYTPKHGSVLGVAAASSREEIAVYLVEQGADPNAADHNGITVLHHAVQNGLSALSGIRYDQYRVAPPNMPKLVEALLKKGADPNVRIQKAWKQRDDRPPFNMEGATPFFLAAMAADGPLMRFLAANGADRSLALNQKTTPLMAAARGNCPGECASQGANWGGDKEREKKVLDAVRAAVELGADLEATNHESKRALHFAAYTGADSVVRYLVEQGAEVDPTDEGGETPWSMAAGISANKSIRGLYGTHPKTAALLLELGAVKRGRDKMDPRNRLGKVGLTTKYEDGAPEWIDPEE